MNISRTMVQILVMLFTAMALLTGQAHAQTSDKALREYEDTVRQADALVAAGNAFEAVRLYERAGRIAYNNKLATDTAAFNRKLNAARAARDAKTADQKPVKPGASPAGDMPAGSTVRAPANTATNSTSPQGVDEWIRYGDGLAAGGEYGDAVRAYERAGRIARSSNLPYDRAALEAKLAAANNAAAAPRASKELIPPPPPPLPQEPGADAGPRFLPQQPGKLRPWSLPHTFVVEENRVTKAEFRALEANLRKIAGVISRAPALNPPMGFELYTSASLDGIEAVEERKRFLAQGLPLRADIVFSAAGYYEARLRSKSSGAITTRIETLEDAHCGLRLYVNIPPVIGVKYGDAEGEFFLEPVKNGELGGLPVYDDVLVVARAADKPWIPVSTERVLKYLLPKYKRDADLAASHIKEKKKSYEAFMSPAAQDKRRQEAQALRAAGGASAEDNARRLEVKQRRWEDDARKEADAAANDPKWRSPIENYQGAQSMLAALDAQGRAAPACVLTGRPQSPESDWKVVTIGTPGCRPVVRSNPALLNSRLPRDALQIMYARNITDCNKYLEEKKHLRNNPGDCVAMAQLLRQIDWQGLAGLLVR